MIFLILIIYVIYGQEYIFLIFYALYMFLSVLTKFNIKIRLKILLFKNVIFLTIFYFFEKIFGVFYFQGYIKSIVKVTYELKNYLYLI